MIWGKGAGQMFEVLVTCHANVCRSPYAAALLGEYLPHREDVRVLSAGVAAEYGHPLCHVAAARLGSLAPSEHHSRNVTADLVNSSDLILTMGLEQSAIIASNWPEARKKIYSLSEAATLSVKARELGLIEATHWPFELPEVLYAVRGLASAPALPDPRGRWRRPLSPGRIADGHGLNQAAHRKVLEQVKHFSLLLAAEPS